MSRVLLVLLNSRKSLSYSFRIIGGASDKYTRLKVGHFQFLPSKKNFDCVTPGKRTCSNAAIQEPTLEEYLINELKCSAETVNEILTNHPKIREVSLSDVSKATQVLKCAQVPTENILRHPWLLTLCPVDLQSKLDLLTSIKAISNTTTPLLIHVSDKLKDFLLKKNFEPFSLPERIDCLCRCLETEPEKLSDRLLTHPYFLTIDIQKVQNIVHLLKEAKVPRPLLSSDLLLFYRDPDKIAERLSRIRALNVKFKPWILRGQPKVFESWLQKCEMRVDIFGGNGDHVDYLADRLQCSHEFVTTVLTYKNDRILSINPRKLKEVLDFLFEKGYTAEDICDTPSILSRSLDTTKKRISEIEKLGLYRPYLKLLQRDIKTYDSNLKKIQRASKRLERHHQMEA